MALKRKKLKNYFIKRRTSSLLSYPLGFGCTCEEEIKKKKVKRVNSSRSVYQLRVIF